MINIKQKKDCCGCKACQQKCPQNSISFTVDSEGFWYPRIDKAKCIDCGLCEKVCPVIQVGNKSVPNKVLACKSKDEQIRERSSSGGFFSLLAKNVILQGGVVFGVVFDGQWNAVFDHTTNIEDLDRFRRSKYIQADILDAYVTAKQLLDEHVLVLFTGTPCQIRGLKLFLDKEYENLLTMDIICHGVPSPGVWQKYLKYERKHIMKDERRRSTILNAFRLLFSPVPRIIRINFRDKRYGWECLGFFIEFELTNSSGVVVRRTRSMPELQNPYMQNFAFDCILRPSCYSCPVREGRSGSDITMADYWGIDNVVEGFNDHKGVSLVLVNTLQGLNHLPCDKEMHSIETTLEQATRQNYSYHSPAKESPRRNYFFSNMDKFEDFSKLTKKTLNPPLGLSRRVKILLKYCIEILNKRKS